MFWWNITCICVDMLVLGTKNLWLCKLPAAARLIVKNIIFKPVIVKHFLVRNFTVFGLVIILNYKYMLFHSINKYTEIIQKLNQRITTRINSCIIRIIYICL